MDELNTIDFRTERGRAAYAIKAQEMRKRRKQGKAIDPEFENCLPLDEAEIYYAEQIRERHRRWESLEQRLTKRYEGVFPHIPVMVTRDRKPFTIPEWDIN